MNGRLYDPVLHRFLQPDNNIQDPLNSQNYNRYGYAWNNPLKYSDPSGEIVWAAVIIGAIIGAASGAAGYIATAIRTGNWSWGQFGLSILGGAVIGGLSGGLNPMSIFSSNLAGSMATAFVGGFMPAHGVQIGDWSISISPSIAFGNSFGMGFNVGVSYSDGDWSFSGGFGAMSYGNYNGFGKNSSQVRYSLLASYDDGKTGFSLGNNFFRGDFQQRTAYLGIRNGDFSLGYENDGSPFSYAGKVLSNNTDMYRTAAAYIGIGDYEMQLNMFTGRSGNDIGQGRDNAKNPNFVDLKEGRTHKTKGVLGLWSNPEANMYRLGSLTLGYKGLRVGLNSEHIRDGFQNWFAHKVLSPQPGFKMLSNGWSGYMQYQTPYKHRSTLW